MNGKIVLVIAGALLVATVGAIAQTAPRIDPPPEEPMAQMMTLMKDVQADVQAMRKQMGGMQGMGPMPGNMDRMMGNMGKMRSMMEQHRLQMQQQCPGFKAPVAPKSGG
jgi:hypothetical protein